MSNDSEWEYLNTVWKWAQGKFFINKISKEQGKDYLWEEIAVPTLAVTLLLLIITVAVALDHVGLDRQFPARICQIEAR
jgi:hypothetical protein